MNKILAFLLALVVLFQTGDAQAIQYKKNVVYKVGDVVYLDGSPSSKSTADFGVQDKTINKTVASCGQITLTAKQIQASPKVKIAAKTIDLSNIKAPAPKCSKGEFTPSTTKPYVTKSGSVAVPGYKPKDKVAVTLSPNYLKKLTFNKCGTARMGNTKTRAIPATFTYNSKSYTLASLPLAPAPARCSSKGVSAPPKDGNPADWGLPTSTALIGDFDEDIVVESSDDDDWDEVETEEAA